LEEKYGGLGGLKHKHRGNTWKSYLCVHEYLWHCLYIWFGNCCGCCLYLYDNIKLQ